MVKHLFSIGLVGGVAVVSACLGDGPTPGAPSGATLLFSTEPAQNCGEGSYIGPVSFGSDHVYVSFLPYQEHSNNCNNNGGGGQIQAPQTVYGYPLAGGTLGKIGSAGVTNDASVQLVATDTGVAYAYNDSVQSNALSFEPGDLSLSAMNGRTIALGMFAVGSDVYVGTLSNYMTNSGTSVIAPSFPNPDATGIIPQGAGEIWHAGVGTAGSWTPECGALDHCLVGNSTSYTFVSSNPGVDASPWQILQVPLSGTTPVKLASSAGNSEVPLGLDTDDHQVAWSTSEGCAQNMTGGPSNCRMTTCNVSIYDTAAAVPKPTTLLSTQQFACIDAKLANGYVYFVIVSLSTENQKLIGRGIGRVAIAGGAVETLDLGIVAPGYGPHRIFPVGDQLYLVDPFVLARIPASALDGKHDFTP